MGFQKIDYAAWPRRPYFEHYHRDVPCWYSMTVDVDISALLPRLRGSGLRFYPAVIHGISRMVNADPALRMAMDETGAIGVYDRVDPTYTIFHTDFKTVPFDQHSQGHPLGDGFAHCTHGLSPFSPDPYHVTGIAFLRGLETGTSYFCIRNSQICAETGPAVRPPNTPFGSFITTVTA